MKPQPAAAIAAASAATEALLDLARTGIHPDTPLAFHADQLNLMHDMTSLLADALQTEARLAAAALTLPLGTEGVPLREEADHVQARLARAGVLADVAADDLDHALRETRKRAAATTQDITVIPDGGPMYRRARIAAHRMADLADALIAAPGQPAAEPLAVLTGHRQITEALTTAAGHLAHACTQLTGPITGAWNPARVGAGPGRNSRATLVTAPLASAAEMLGKARRLVFDAQGQITSVRELQHLVPAVTQ